MRACAVRLCHGHILLRSRTIITASPVVVRSFAGRSSSSPSTSSTKPNKSSSPVSSEPPSSETTTSSEPSASTTSSTTSSTSASRPTWSSTRRLIFAPLENDNDDANASSSKSTSKKKNKNKPAIRQNEATATTSTTTHEKKTKKKHVPPMIDRTTTRRKDPNRPQEEPHVAHCQCAICGGKPTLTKEKNVGPMAIYVNMAGEYESVMDPVFTGIVQRKDGSYWKLNNPNHFDIDNLSAPEDGHVMEELEYQTEMLQYSKDEEEASGNGTIRVFSKNGKDHNESLLLNFESHPHDWFDDARALPPRDMFDDEHMYKLFPFPNANDDKKKNDRNHKNLAFDAMTAKQVRALDGVMLVAEPTSTHYEEPNERRPNEAFWASVVSVTSTGIVTAICRAKVPLLHMQEDDFLAFSITNVLAVKYGPNHPHEHHDDDRPNPPRRTSSTRRRG